MLKKLLTVSLFLVAFGVACPSLAEDDTNDPFLEWLEKTQIDGDIRSYYFTRDYTNPDLLNQSAYSLGGNLRFITAPFLQGFQIGAAYYTAQSLGLNSDNPVQVDQTLPGKDIGVLGQAYIQYTRAPFFIRAGDQIITTPWIAPGDSRIIPASYRAVYATWAPLPDLIFTGLRVFEFKSRVADDFSKTNLYNPENLGTPIAKLDDQTNQGAWAVGGSYHWRNLNSQLWFYQFLDYGKLIYDENQLVIPVNPAFSPLLGAQAFNESGDGDNVLAQVSSGKANSAGYGLLGGFVLYNAKVTLGFNQILTSSGAFKNGDVVSPYTTGYADDPLFTTSMIAGLIEKSAGKAYKITGSYAALQKDWLFSVSYAQYFTEPQVPNTDETDFDVTYLFDHCPYSYLRHLSIRDRLGIQTGDPSKGTFYYNRVMLQYSF
ncbi:MAG: OprD family outer membrane porin [Proteobacteria bacterium]|nr:OprD family outer membrane porin [Pseudomonadota bacterium]